MLQKKRGNLHSLLGNPFLQRTHRHMCDDQSTLSLCFEVRAESTIIHSRWAQSRNTISYRSERDITTRLDIKRYDDFKHKKKDRNLKCLRSISQRERLTSSFPTYHS